MLKNYYARIDWTVKENNPSFGFANTKKVLIFKSKKERDEYVITRKDYDLACCAVSYRDAIKEREEAYGGLWGFYDADNEFFEVGVQSKYI